MALEDLLSQLPPQPLPQCPASSRGFLLFVSFAGDYVRTAQALGWTVDAVKEAAQVLQWDQRMASIMSQVRSQRPGDMERAVNRSLCFVQAHQIREVLDRLVQHLYGQTAEQLVTMHTPLAGANKGAFQSRSITDLVTAIEKCHAMLYAALGDTGGERTRRALLDDGAPGQTPSDAFASMARQVAELANGSTRALLAEAQQVRAEALTPSSEKCLSEVESLQWNSRQLLDAKVPQSTD